MSDDKKPIDEVTGTETTGHNWDGIEELNNPLPRWWLWCLYLCIAWGVLYSVAYPAWPLINGATAGVLGYSTRAEVAEEIAQVDAANADLNAQLAEVDLASLDTDSALGRYARAAGAAVFLNNCTTCHGQGAAGSEGFPNLLDDDWLWGGSFEEISYTITHGIRNEEDWDARWSEMTAFEDILTREEIGALVQYVRSISGQDADVALAEVGAPLFADNCAACHMDGGTGDRALGAPNLTDAVWLYGGDEASLEETIRYARFGVMPPWGSRLSVAEIQAVTAYVHQLGGGE